VALEPAQAVFVDLFMLDKVDTFSGLDPWVERLSASLSPERWQMNHVVINGLYYALLPTAAYASFPEYIDDLAAQDPASWIDRMLAVYEQIGSDAANDAPTRRELLEDVDLYLAYLRQRFPPDVVDESVERQVHAWMGAPGFMQDVVLEHLRTMWREHLGDAWERSLPLVRDCVAAFREVEWPVGSNVELYKWVTGQDLSAWHESKVAAAGRVRFVPSAHVGPYVGLIPGEDVVWVVFGARLPEGALGGSSALSRSDLLIRLNALADENRLHILEILAEHDEMCAQDVMDRIGLSQSSTSRHLRQLSASGYLLERRQESAKCYRLNRRQVESTLAALSRFFGQGLAD
jgi:DNA-binding transcriptional ArsR family regulator